MTIRKLLQTDARWSQRIRIAERPGPARAAAVFLAHSGDSWFWILGLAIVLWRGDTYWKVRSAALIAAILLLALIVMTIKLVFRRRRPEGEWGAFYRNTDPHSFPSGHAARAALLAALLLGWGPLWLGLILVVWAPLVSLARAAMGVHYLSDVLAGTVLGILGGTVLLLAIPSPEQAFAFLR